LIRYLLIATLFVLSLTACDRGVLVSETWKWKDHQWVSGDVKSMKMTARDTTTVYQLDLRVDHEENFAYQNLYVRTRTTYPSGKEVTSVTSLELINADGSWAGDKGENCCTLTLPLQARFTFPETGTYTWTIEPYMRIDTVKGINSLKAICKPVKL
jgi:gliding motility-associated lipoprotein GldH